MVASVREPDLNARQTELSPSDRAGVRDPAAYCHLLKGEAIHHKGSDFDHDEYWICDRNRMSKNEANGSAVRFNDPC